MQSKAKSALMYASLKLEIIGARMRKRLTELDVATGTGLSVSTVKDIEGWGANPSLDDILRIVAFLDLELSVRPVERSGAFDNLRQPL